METRGRKLLEATLTLLLIAVICVNLIFPLLTLLGKSLDFSPFYEGFRKTLSGAATKRAIGNSLKVTLTASAISVSAAFFFAYIVELKLKPKARRVLRFASILPMLVPSITHGVVIVYLFGNMGIFTRLFGVHLPIYGPLGIIMGSFFYAFPTAFIVLSQAFANLDGRYFETSRMLGASPNRRFFDIILPIMKYAVFSAFAVCFTMIFTDYGIPVSVGGTYPVLSVLFYKNVIGMLDFSKGAIFSTIILLPAAGVYLLDTLYFSKKNTATSQNIRPVDSGRFSLPQRLGFALVLAVILIPVLVICVSPFISAWPYDVSLTLRHFQRLVAGGAIGRLLTNSLGIAAATGAIGTVLAFAAGYIYVRCKTPGLGKLKKLMHGLYMVSLAIPGLALGLSFALFFRGTPLYNTTLVLVIVNIIHFFGSPYMMVLTHLKLLNPNLESICRTLGGGTLRAITSVILPNSKKVLFDIFVYFFTNSMVTISAVSLLYKASTMTLALQITAFNDQGAWESAIAVSLIIFAINMAIKLIQAMRLTDRKGKAAMPEAK